MSLISSKGVADTLLLLFSLYVAWWASVLQPLHPETVIPFHEVEHKHTPAAVWTMHAMEILLYMLRWSMKADRNNNLR